MRINFIQSLNKQPNLTFCGLKTNNSQSLFVFDLDGTFANSSSTEIEKILSLKTQKNAKLVYATGRNLEKFYQLRETLLAKKIDLPVPDYLIARNGLYLYENIDGQLKENETWKSHVYNSFDKEKILNIVKEVAFSPDYLISPIDSEKNSRFENSKLCKFEFWGSDRMLQFVCDNSVAQKTEKVLNEKFKENSVNAIVLRQVFPTWMWNKLSSPEQLAIVNQRRSGQDYCNQIDILPVDKASAVRFLQVQKLNIPSEEILIAGNDDNDITMAYLANSGANFICLANSSQRLKNICCELNKLQSSVYCAKKSGAKGILEGIGNICRKDNACQKDYDELFGTFLKCVNEKEKMANAVKEIVKSSDVIPILETAKQIQILDIGCANGDLSHRILEGISSVLPKQSINVDAFDINEKLLNEFLHKTLPDNVDLKTHFRDFFDVKSDKKYDLVIASQVLYYVKDLCAAINKIKSKLSENGVAIIIHHSGDNSVLAKLRAKHNPKSNANLNQSLDEMEKDDIIAKTLSEQKISSSNYIKEFDLKLPNEIEDFRKNYKNPLMVSKYKDFKNLISFIIDEPFESLYT